MNDEIELAELFGLFGDLPPEHEAIDQAAVPEPYHGMLVHPHHMTVTVEAYYGDTVNIRVLGRHVEGDSYARKIILERNADGLIVQFGIVRIQLDLCPPEVKAAILAETAPLGRILIEHEVLLRIEPTTYLRVPSAQWFAPLSTRSTFGRLGYIHVNEKPAVELVEILAPVPMLP